jgi:predicted PolB exonuclease-like 3'-5' exonuclease
MSTSYVLDLEAVTFGPLNDVWLADQKDKEAFPPPFCWEIVCLGYAKLNNYKLEKLGASCLPGEEKEGIENFNKAVESNKARIISWNGRCYDLPVVSYRSMYHGIPMQWYHVDKSGYKYRYSGDKHYDVKDYLSEYGQHKISLNHATKLIGLPGKMEAKGSDVAQMHAEGNTKDIVAYCMTDVLQTLIVFWRVEFLRGVLTKDQYVELVTDLHAKIKSEGELNVVKDDKYTILGNNIETANTMAISKGCRTLYNKWDFQKTVSV